MPTLKEFIEALKAEWFPALAALIGCSVVIAGDWYSVPYFSDTPPWLITTVLVVGVFALSVLLANIAYIPILLATSFLRWRRRIKYAENIRNEVENAPAEERAVLAYLLSTGRRAFTAKIDDRRLTPLVSKGIILKLGGTNNMLEWPHAVQDDVWLYLLANREKYFMQDARALPNPFEWRSLY